MYWISDKEKADSLAKKARDMETKIKSQCIKEEEQEKKKKHLYRYRATNTR